MTSLPHPSLISLTLHPSFITHHSSSSPFLTFSHPSFPPSLTYHFILLCPSCLSNLTLLPSITYRYLTSFSPSFTSIPPSLTHPLTPLPISASFTASFIHPSPFSFLLLLLPRLASPNPSTSSSLTLLSCYNLTKPIF